MKKYLVIALALLFVAVALSIRNFSEETKQVSTQKQQTTKVVPIIYHKATSCESVELPEKIQFKLATTVSFEE
jgi:uncharacterized alpha/beta hydrolase family protein